MSFKQPAKGTFVNWECLVYTVIIMFKQKYEIIPFLNKITCSLLQNDQQKWNALPLKPGRQIPFELKCKLWSMVGVSWTIVLRRILKAWPSSEEAYSNLFKKFYWCGNGAHKTCVYFPWVFKKFPHQIKDSKMWSCVCFF